MTTLEDRVRDALQADAETVRPDTIPGVPARPTRSTSGLAGLPRVRILIPLAAAAAVAAIVTAVAVIAPHSRLPGSGSNAPLPLPVLGAGGRSASPGVPASLPPPGAPPYYVTLEPANPTTGYPSSVVVRRSTTGGNVFLRLPPRGTSFGALAVKAGNQTFVTAVTLSGKTCPARSELYQFEFGDQGELGSLTPLNIEIPGSFNRIGTLAITPDGHTIAYDTWLCGQDRSEVGVIDLVSGHVRVWEVPGTSSVQSLSLSGDGSLLAYDSLPGGAAILRTNAPSGPLFQRSKVVSRGALWARLASDGTTLYACSVARSPGTPKSPVKVGSLTYYAQSLSGRGRRVIASWNNLPYPQCWASLEPAGHYLLVQYPVAVQGASDWVQPAVLDINTGQLTRIRTVGTSYYGPLDVAW